MREQHHTIGPLAAALDLAAKGYHCIPLTFGSKAPSLRWKRYQALPPDSDELRQLFAAPDQNIAILCGELIVVDCDSSDVESFVLGVCGPTPYRCRTPRGGLHLGYRAERGLRLGNRVKINGRPIDLRGFGGYAVVPPSVKADDVPYRWESVPSPLSELPLFDTSWLQEPPRAPFVPLVIAGDDAKSVRRARAYLTKIDGAVSGERGHDRTFRTACVLVQKFGLDFERALPLFEEWNERCDPPWSLAELRHKLSDAFKKRRT